MIVANDSRNNEQRRSERLRILEEARVARVQEAILLAQEAVDEEDIVMEEAGNDNNNDEVEDVAIVARSYAVSISFRTMVAC